MWVALSFCLAYFLPYFYRYYKQGRIRRFCRVNGYVVLTFDDGPNRELTNYILGILDKNHLKATFFVLGEKLTANKEIVRRMTLSGHEIGCHGFRHVNAWKSTPWTAMRDIKNAKQTLSNMGITCRLFRPPCGKITIFTWIAIIFSGMNLAWWTVVSGDTHKKLPCPDRVVDNLIKSGGGVILMHDIHTEKERKNFVISVTEKIISLSKKNGLHIKTLGEVLSGMK